MKSAEQLTFFPDEPGRRVAAARQNREALPAATGFPIEPEEVITSIDDAVEHLGLELGRLGTVLNRVTDYALLGSFSQLYALNLTRYADLLLKKKALDEQPAGDLLDLLGPALDRLNQTVELEL